MASEARVRQLLLNVAAAIDAESASAVAAECAATANDYQAAANLLRSYAASAATKPQSYRMTDGKQVARVSVADVVALADSYDKMAVSGGAFATVDGQFEVDVAGQDITTFENE